MPDGEILSASGCATGTTGASALDAARFQRTRTNKDQCIDMAMLRKGVEGRDSVAGAAISTSARAR